MNITIDGEGRTSMMIIALFSIVVWAVLSMQLIKPRMTLSRSQRLTLLGAGTISTAFLTVMLIQRLCA